MTQEDKELLLKYLCMALPYGLVIKTPIGRDYLYKIYIYSQPEGIAYINKEGFTTEECKPYLRPMSSMTKVEKIEYDTLILFNEDSDALLEDRVNIIIFFLENHFDFMGLIPKGLAIEVNESNNPYN